MRVCGRRSSRHEESVLECVYADRCVVYVGMAAVGRVFGESERRLFSWVSFVTDF